MCCFKSILSPFHIDWMTFSKSGLPPFNNHTSCFLNVKSAYSAVRTSDFHVELCYMKLLLYFHHHCSRPYAAQYLVQKCIMYRAGGFISSIRVLRHNKYSEVQYETQHIQVFLVFEVYLLSHPDTLSSYALLSYYASLSHHTLLSYNASLSYHASFSYIAFPSYNAFLSYYFV